jgi:hypothetical protein
MAGVPGMNFHRLASKLQQGKFNATKNVIVKQSFG